MLKITKPQPNRLEVEFNGKLTADGMRKSIDDMVSQAQDIDQGTMLCRVTDFSFPSLGALGVEISRLPTVLKMVRKFKRMAVLADKKWIRHLSEFEGALFPGLEVKAFESDKQADAERWLNSI